jgi:hypothetical protein
VLVNAIAFDGVNEQSNPGYMLIKTTFFGLFGEIVSMSTPENVIGRPTTKTEGEMFTVSTVPKTGEATSARAITRNGINSKPTSLDMTFPYIISPYGYNYSF